MIVQNLNAIYYAAARAAKSDGAVEILGIIGPKSLNYLVYGCDESCARQRIKTVLRNLS